VVVVDNFSNSKPEALRRVEEIAGRKLLAFYRADIRDKARCARSSRPTPSMR
jgi:UDP-glucose 4-epimerase